MEKAEHNEGRQQRAEPQASAEVGVPIRLSVDMLEELAAARSSDALSRTARKAGFTRASELARASPEGLAELLDFRKRPAVAPRGGSVWVGLAAVGIGVSFAIAENTGEPLVAAIGALVCAGVALLSIAGRASPVTTTRVRPGALRAVRAIIPGLGTELAVRAALEPCVVAVDGVVIDNTLAGEMLLRGWVTELEKKGERLADAEGEMDAAVAILTELASLPSQAGPDEGDRPEVLLKAALSKHLAHGEKIANALMDAQARLQAIRRGEARDADSAELARVLSDCDAWGKRGEDLLRQVGQISRGPHA